MARVVGVAELPLHRGAVPRWLFRRMVSLAGGIVAVIVDEYGRDELLRRLSSPFWFQAFGCVLGFDWHSSGLTTVVSAALREALKPEELRVAVCGGKGKASRKTPEEILSFGELFGLSESHIDSLQYASRMSAKVDNTAIQAGYPLYHHVFVFTEDGNWVVVQQGMNVDDGTARRYHWLSERVESFVVEPHSAIVGDTVRRVALDMTARKSEGCRKVSVDLAKEDPKRLARLLSSVRPPGQKSLAEWVDVKDSYEVQLLRMPRRINWEALRRAYETQPRNYEELLGIRGIGPATVRGLALISELIYGEPPSWKDPVKYSFAFGGKDGVPRPIDRKALDEAIKFLKEAIQQAKINEKERLHALKRLKSLAPKTAPL